MAWVKRGLVLALAALAGVWSGTEAAEPTQPRMVSALPGIELRLLEVAAPTPFWLQETELTQAQWAAVVRAGKAAQIAEAEHLDEWPSYYENPERPVEQVSWCMAVRFANVLSILDKLPPAYKVGENCDRGELVLWVGQSQGYRLPTLGEWNGLAQAVQGHVATPSSQLAYTLPVCSDGLRPGGFCNLQGNVSELLWDGESDVVLDPPSDGSKAAAGAAAHLVADLRVDRSSRRATVKTLPQATAARLPSAGLRLALGVPTDLPSGCVWDREEALAILRERGVAPLQRWRGSPGPTSMPGGPADPTLSTETFGPLSFLSFDPPKSPNPTTLTPASTDQLAQIARRVQSDASRVVSGSLSVTASSTAPSATDIAINRCSSVQDALNKSIGSSVFTSCAVLHPPTPTPEGSGVEIRLVLRKP